MGKRPVIASISSVREVLNAPSIQMAAFFAFFQGP